MFVVVTTHDQVLLCLLQSNWSNFGLIVGHLEVCHLTSLPNLRDALVLRLHFDDALHLLIDVHVLTPLNLMPIIPLRSMLPWNLMMNATVLVVPQS